MQAQKALYQLKQAPRAWYEKLKKALVQWGFLNSAADTSFFYCTRGGKMLLVLIYVDDILITTADQAQVNQLISDLTYSFALGSVSYFLGFEAYRDH